MSKVFVVVFLIFGSIMGSGFSSGKEIMVFFSRFGVLSYLYILIAGFLFFWLFYFLLNAGNKIEKVLQKSKILNLVILFISVVFCASMFAGLDSLYVYLPQWIRYVFVGFGVLMCIFITLKGVKGLEKLNIILMPATTIIFLVVLVYSFSLSSNFSFDTNSWAGFLYGPLYVSLNTSMSALVISKTGSGLTKKQTVIASLFSSLLIVLFLLIGNFVLQRNLDSALNDMPFLYIVSNNKCMFGLIYFVILVGCFTTLISLSITIKSAFDKVIHSEWKSTLFSVFLPFLLGLIGFSPIVSFLYPICSVLGVFVLLLFVFCEDKNTFKKQKE